MKNKIAFLYPQISHYREEFFSYFIEHYDCDIYTYESLQAGKKNNFSISPIKTIKLKSLLLFSKLRVFNFFPLLNTKYDVIIVIGEMKVLPVWFLLIFSKLFRKKIVLWGHGISIHAYLHEEKKFNPIRVIFHHLANHIWLYTDNEVKLWKNYFPESKLTSINNTINIESILKRKILDKTLIKTKYNIFTKINLIYCARFSMTARRTDLLEEIVERLDSQKYGFIIIGDGPLKPNFSKYSNVFDFGAVYDSSLKNELFQIADLYLQPGWIGLSCNEALAYGKPVLTFKRSNEIAQCVEYGYLNSSNSYIAENVENMLLFIQSLDDQDILKLQRESEKFAEKNLRMESMISQARQSLEILLKD